MSSNLKPTAWHVAKRKQTRDLALTIRESFPAEIALEWAMAIMAGHNAVIEPDKRTEAGYKVTWPEHETGSTLEQRMRMWESIISRGWGTPVNKIQLEGEIRQLQLSVTADASDIQNILTYEMRQKIKEILSGQTNSQAELDAAIDVTPTQQSADLDVSEK